MLTPLTMLTVQADPDKLKILVMQLLNYIRFNDANHFECWLGTEKSISEFEEDHEDDDEKFNIIIHYFLDHDFFIIEDHQEK